MQLTRGLKLLVLGLSAVSVAEATFVNINHVGRDGKAIQRRQDDETKSEAAVTSTSSSAPATETTTSQEPASTSSTPTVSSTSIQQTPTSSSTKPPAQSSSSSQDLPSSTSTDVPASSTTSSEESSSVTESPESSTSLEVSTITEVKTITNADGSQQTLTSKTVTTSPPNLANNGNSSQESGMSTQTRNTVIGVVVGIGGAIILGGLAFVAWRIWGRKRNQEENDVLMDYGSHVEKPETSGSMGGRTPFQSTLESYHAPTQVNTAANF